MDGIDSGDRISFSIDSSFQAVAPTGGLNLGPLELQYQDLFAEALEDGVITADERARLERAAANLGIDRARLERLEEAMTAAYETHHRMRVVDLTLPSPQSIAPLKDAPPLSARPIASAPPSIVAPKNPEVARLTAENQQLRARIAALEEELQRAQAAVNVEVDLSHLEIDAASFEDPEDVYKRVRLDPSDVEAMRALKEAFDSKGNTDGKYLACQALVGLGAATPEEAALAEQHRTHTLIAPQRGFDESLWRSTLFHPEEDATTGALFAVVAPAILVGRVTTLRRDGLLHHGQAERKQDPATSTVMSVRALGWAAALLGLPTPQVYAEPDADTAYLHVAQMPPYTVLGARALSGRSVSELAFLVGRHMTGYRGEHFVRTLFSGTEDLEDLFLAALLIANPKLPLKSSKRARIEPLARAIEPMLDAPAQDRLRAAYLQFAEDGGRTNLQRWSAAVDKTAARVGLALSQDLQSALDLLKQEEGPLGPLALDLIAYSTSQRFRSLRQNLMIALS